MPVGQTYTGEAVNVIAWGVTPSVGSVVVMMSSSLSNPNGIVYGGDVTGGDDGWIDLTPAAAGGLVQFGPGGSAGFAFWARTVDGSESWKVALGDTLAVSFTGGVGPGADDPQFVEAQGPGNHATVTNNPTGVGTIIEIGAFIQDNAGALTPDAGWTKATEFLKPANGWKFSLLYKEEANAGTYTPGVVAVGAGGWGALALALAIAAPPPPPPPPPVQLNICDPDGQNCILIERAIAKKVRIELNGTGAGAFQISRYDEQATFDILSPGNILQFTFPEIDEDVLVECILEEGDFTLISSDEEGGELLTFGGRGTLAAGAYTVMGHEWLDHGHPKLNFPSEGVWRWTSEEAAGIIRRTIDEAQLHTPPALALITKGGDPVPWDDNSDSYGNAFYDMAGQWEIPIGQVLLTAWLDLCRAGMIQLEMRPGFVMWAYDEQGFDRTGGAFGTGVVRFEKGVNIGGFDSTELARQMRNENFASAALVGGPKGGYIWRYAASTPYVKEKFLDFRGTDLSGDAVRAAARAFLRGAEETEAILFEVTPTGPNGEENDEAGGWYYPGYDGTDHGKYWLGDLITLHTGDDPDIDYSNATFKIYAINLYEDEIGRLAPPIVELNAQFTPADSSGGGGSLGGGSTTEGGTGVGTGAGGPVNTPHVHTQYQVTTDDKWHQPVRVATTGNITISTGLNSGDTVDGVTLAVGDRVLVRAQSAPAQNGIYVAGPTPARAVDMDETDEVVGSVVYVVEGTANGGKVFQSTNDAAPVIGTDAITWAAASSVPDGTDPGDLLVWDGAAWDVLPIEADGTVLTADSGEALGVAWTAPAGGGGGSQSYVGYNTVGGSNEAPANKKVLATKITLASAAELLSIGVHLKTNSSTPGALAWGVWEDNAGVPRALMAAVSTPAQGFLFTPGSDRYRWVDFPVGMHLPAGSYWIGFMFDGSFQIKYDTSGADHSITSGGWWIPDWDFYTDSNTTKKYSIRGSILG